MKTLHVIPSIDPKGGGPIEGLTNITRELKSQGHSPEILSLDMPDVPWVKNFSIPVHTLGPSYTGYLYCPKLVPWLKKHAHEYDAIIVNGIWQYPSFGVWHALKDSSTPYFNFTNGMLDPWFRYEYPLKHLKKWLYWPWGQYPVLRDAKGVFFTCEEEKILARESFWLYKCNEIVVSYGAARPPANGPELKATFLTKFPELKSKKIALFLSRIHEKKGCDVLIEAFAKVAYQDSNLHLVIAGPDQVGLKPILEQQIASFGIENKVTWTGMLQGDLKWGAFYVSDVFVLPSHQENFGIVVAESLACGKPVLISNKVNIWREIEKDSAGFVAPDTVEGTVQNFDRWLKLDKVSYEKLCENAKSSYEARFTIKKVVENLLKTIQEA